MKSNPVGKLQTPSTFVLTTQALADEIQQYLASHPTAADSLDGIGTQWLASNAATEQQVRAAIELLIAQGKLGANPPQKNSHDFERFIASHANDAAFDHSRRSFYEYCDLEIKKATDGRIDAQVIRAAAGKEFHSSANMAV